MTRWAVDQVYRDAMIKRMVRIAIDPESDPKAATAAAKVVLMAESQNQADEHLEFKTKAISGRLASRMVEIAKRIGIKPPPFGDDAGGVEGIVVDGSARGEAEQIHPASAGDGEAVE